MTHALTADILMVKHAIPPSQMASVSRQSNSRTPPAPA